jgi:hypothetical protein
MARKLDGAVIDLQFFAGDAGGRKGPFRYCGVVPKPDSVLVGTQPSLSYYEKLADAKTRG